MLNKELAVIIDGSSFIFRAFFACPSIKLDDGRSAGAVHGFCSMLISQLCKHDADFFCVAMDSGRHTFRLEMYPQYKGNRAAVPDDLKEQMPLMLEACDAFGLPVISLRGFEADDIIASYASKLSTQNYKVRIVGIDKDLLQLMSDSVEIYDPVKSKIITEKDVMEKYGVTPSKMVDFQALTGDKTDNIPGVAGIGPITAAKLINNYGSLQEIYANVNEISPIKLKEKLIADKEAAELSKKLAYLDRCVEIPADFLPAKLNYDHKKAYDFLANLNFKDLISRMYKTFMYAKSNAAFLQQEKKCIASNFN